MTSNLAPNLHADMRGVKDYTLESGTKFRWARNTKDGITLQEELVAYIDVGKPIPERHHLNWHSVANVHKPKRGNRFVVEVRGHTKLFSFPKLREAMRMAKFLYQTRHNI